MSDQQKQKIDKQIRMAQALKENLAKRKEQALLRAKKTQEKKEKDKDTL
ncbi:MAG: hypothetical protein Q8K36_04250 [Alphaproteobacteria bacterium]|nr:hypothetical protein [Alphaproteobacteria bacterium]